MYLVLCIRYYIVFPSLAPCACVAAITVSELLDMKNWTFATVDNILDLGNELYLESIKHVADKNKKKIAFCEVYHTYYVGNIRITMCVEGERCSGHLSAATDDVQNLNEGLKAFFERNISGVLITLDKYFSIWKQGEN